MHQFKEGEICNHAYVSAASYTLGVALGLVPTQIY